MEEKFLEVAKQAATEAGELVFKYYRKKNIVKNKNDDPSNLVTEADLNSQKLIISLINNNFPTHNIIAEEGNSKNTGSEYTWTVDPLDGTISFVHGLPHFSVAVGLMKNNKPILGAIYNVVNKDLYYARIGSGAYCNNKKIQVSQIKTLEDAAVILGFGSIKKRLERFDKYILKVIGKVGFPFSIGSGSTGHVFLSRGLVEATFDIGWIWDFVPSAVIIKEAGGKVSDFEGNEPDWSKDRISIVASNGLIHDQILEVIKA